MNAYGYGVPNKGKYLISNGVGYRTFSSFPNQNARDVIVILPYFDQHMFQ